LIKALKVKGAKLSVVDGQLRCQAPPGVLKGELLAQLKANKAAITGLLAQPGGQKISKRAADAKLGLSHAQQRLWFVDQLEGPSNTYHMPGIFNIEGDLDVALVQQCWQRLIDRHEILRCTITYNNTNKITNKSTNTSTNTSTNEDDNAVQTFTQHHLDFEHRVIELGEKGAPGESGELKTQTDAFFARDFDLSSGPLLKLMVLSWPGQQHRLLINLHHIIADGWSLGLLIKEFVELYKGLSLDDKTLDFGDYVLWQRQTLNPSKLAQQTDYWRNELDEAPPLLKLPLDYPRPAKQTYTGGLHLFELNAKQQAGLKKLAQDNGASMNMVLISLFNVLLSRYSGQQDIVIGSPVAGRNNRQLEDIIGLFINNTVLRTVVDENRSFVELLGGVKQKTLQNFNYQDLPFEQLIQTLQPQRNLSYSPIFQVMFMMENTPAHPFELPGLTITPVDNDNIRAKFDLLMSFEEHVYGLKGSLIYNISLFKEQTIITMAEHFDKLVSQVLTAPQQPLYQQSMFSEQTKQQLLDLSKPAVDNATVVVIVRAFERHAKVNPEKLAVVTLGSTIDRT
ncbi:MAG: hypothetical protein HRT35_38795, partial [Algicola sp.]|nr:hypothetical protein [Algicola sp.]